ncbi:FAD/NAD(P)-binding domain-containing protein [Cryphonectria parasitica EP155]|uniref:FAD/NAD(P)-binding domain-containing protein n=1 Tax=Cryphonectria parasitica (strain ATCC 38755 / EP155) TaxID=660469 RepID=A0A9P5CNM1_CRYP1|nr:FAD/NAD(P)-binding domain-containing protein [Cryphonectria parasitica EP155]KAF3765288.1 FAD/NAD(P)-binding domain-containing protein [Cryphonectria parasitica EP155]
MAESSSTIKIAVIGGGLAGASIANALLRYAHLEVHVYESAPEFSERGAAIGLSGDAQRALQKVVGVSEASAMLQRPGAVLQASTRTCIGSGTHAEAVIVDLGDDPEGSTRVVHRASLLRELLTPLPAKRLHTRKALSEITGTAAGDVQVTFCDGQNETFHAVIGADGIFGAVRRYVLQESADDDGPFPAGCWDCRNVVPINKARDTLGAQYFEQDRQYGWVGNRAFVMHDVLENRTKVQCVISTIEKDPPKDRRRPLTREFMEETLLDWMDGPVGKGIIDRRFSDLFKWSSMYCWRRAHATNPWQGAGTGQAFEDAIILVTLLGETKVSSEISRAFQAYGTGLILCGQDAGLDPDKIRDLLAPRWGLIAGIDLAAYKEEALQKMKALREV